MTKAKVKKPLCKPPQHVLVVEVGMTDFNWVCDCGKARVAVQTVNLVIVPVKET